MAMNQGFFTKVHVYFCSEKHGENSPHHRTLNLLVVRRRLCARKTWVLLLAGLETEFRSHCALKRMMQWLRIGDLAFMVQKKRLHVTYA